MTGFMLLTMAALMNLVIQDTSQTIHDLCRSGDIERVKLLLTKQPNLIRALSEDRETPLHVAVWQGHRKLVEYLLQQGADFNAEAYNHFTPLHLAKDEEIVKLLLAKKPSFQVYDSMYQSQLEHAAEHAFRYETSERRDVQYKLEHEKLVKITRLIIDAGAYYDIRSAIYLNDIERVKTILKSEPERANDLKPELPLERRRNVSVPLRIAARTGRVEICKVLLKAKADPDDFTNYSGLPIICDAVKYSEIVKLLIEAGANLKKPIDSRWMGRIVVSRNATALHYTVADLGTIDTAQLLIKHGVPIDAQDGAGNSSLHLAAGLGNFKMTKFLIEKGAKVDFKNATGKTPIEMINELTYYNAKPASKSEVKQMEKLLQECPVLTGVYTPREI